MFDYLKGIVTKCIANYIVVDVNGVGYRVYTSNPYSDYYKMLILAHNEEEARMLAEAKFIVSTEKIISITEVDGTARIIAHDSIKY